MNKLIYKYLNNLLDVAFSYEAKTTSDPIIFILESLKFIINFKKNKDEIKLSFIEIELNIIKMKA